MTDTTALFAPFQYRSLRLANRVVMAPMTRYFSPDGIPTAAVAEYYRKRAAGGVGLIITEGAGIDREAARRDPNVPNFHGREALDAWKTVIDGIHEADAAVAPQLWHVGASPPRVADAAESPRESPSGFFGPAIERGRPMTEQEIADTIDAYARAGLEAKRLGCEAVEFHGAHGYLLDQFFWQPTNKRDDRFGGPDLESRSRFAIETIKATRRLVGDDMTLLFRISQWKIPDYAAKNAATAAELEAWLTPLVDAGVDIIHCSQRRFWEPEFPGSTLNLAGWAKKVTGRPTITVGSVGLAGEFLGAPSGGPIKVAPLDDLLERLDREEFDLVAVGRALISEPAWAEKIRTGRTDELAPFDPEHTKVLV